MTFADSNHRSKRELELELADILRAAAFKGRQARAVAARLGWDGGGSRTLAAAAAPEGYSRERVRQLEQLVRERVPQSRFDATATEAALRLVEEAAPIASRDVAGRLAAAGVSRRPFNVAGLLSAAEILGLEHCIEEQNGVIVRWGQRDAAGAELARPAVREEAA